jgi:hypothetical protein
LHVLATDRCAGVVFLAMTTDFIEHLRVDFKPAPLG